MATIEEMRNQVRSLNAQYKATLAAETQEDEDKEKEAVFSSPYTNDKDVYLSLVDKDFEIISEVLDVEVKRRKNEYTFEEQEDLDSGSIRYEYLSRKATQKSVVISRRVERRIIISCIRNQIRINSINNDYLLNLIDKLQSRK